MQSIKCRFNDLKLNKISANPEKAILSAIKFALKIRKGSF